MIDNSARENDSIDRQSQLLITWCDYEYLHIINSKDIKWRYVYLGIYVYLHGLLKHLHLFVAQIITGYQFERIKGCHEE